MSIIEKAAGKIGTGAPRPAPQGGSGDSGHDASLIENALIRRRSGHAAPFVATPVEPMFSSQDADDVLEGNSQVQSINL
ncbi:MAG TPA: protein tyrosine kinase, partial [Thiobacillus sp.]|nr:protein tyrosine kinase [Thiobacillus sp.]